MGDLGTPLLWSSVSWSSCIFLSLPLPPFHFHCSMRFCLLFQRGRGGVRADCLLFHFHFQKLSFSVLYLNSSCSWPRALALTFILNGGERPGAGGGEQTSG